MKTPTSSSNVPFRIPLDLMEQVHRTIDLTSAQTRADFVRRALEVYIRLLTMTRNGGVETHRLYVHNFETNEMIHVALLF